MKGCYALWLPVAAKISGSFITATVGALGITANENLQGGFGLGMIIAQVGQLGVFGVIKQGPLEFAEYAVVQVKAHFLQRIFDRVQGDVTNVVTDLDGVITEPQNLPYAIDAIQQQSRRGCRIVFLLWGHKQDFALFNEIIAISVHILIVAIAPE